MRYTVTDGVAFFEGDVPGARKIKAISVKNSSMFRSSQLSSIESVKKMMADQARKLGGNCILCFRYGQKQPSFLASILVLMRDDVYWYGEGIVGVVDPDSI